MVFMVSCSSHAGSGGYKYTLCWKDPDGQSPLLHPMRLLPPTRLAHALDPSHRDLHRRSRLRPSQILTKNTEDSIPLLPWGTHPIEISMVDLDCILPRSSQRTQRRVWRRPPTTARVSTTFASRPSTVEDVPHVQHTRRRSEPTGRHGGRCGTGTWTPSDQAGQERPRGEKERGACRKKGTRQARVCCPNVVVVVM